MTLESESGRESGRGIRGMDGGSGEKSDINSRSLYFSLSLNFLFVYTILHPISFYTNIRKTINFIIRPN